MKKFITFIFTIFLFFSSIQVIHAQSNLDLVSFMSANFSYQGFTQNDSYLELIAHRYDPQNGVWKHTVPFLTCPTSLQNNCENLDWHFYYLSRKKPNENIIYQSKSIQTGKNLEVFWFNNDWIYDFGEPFLDNNYCRPGDTSCFHNFYHDDNSIPFPNRGSIWYKRFFNPGDEISGPVVKIKNYRSLQQYNCDLPNLPCLTEWPNYFVNTAYFPSWNSQTFTWNNSSDFGNLPNNLEVVVLTSEVRSPFRFKEKYYYAKNGSNTFGLIRFDQWQPKSQTCPNLACTNAVVDGDFVLTTYNTFNLLTKFPDDINNHFLKSYYSDPKLESNPTNGAFIRGKIRIDNLAQASDGQNITAGNYLSLTEILTDADWLLSPLQNINGALISCSNGYQYLGSLVTAFYDHQNNFHNPSWANLCGTNNKVLFAATCPNNYLSRGWIRSNSPLTEAYDYLSRPVGGLNLHLCVAQEETLVSNKKLLVQLPGDLDSNARVDIYDYSNLVQNFGKKGTPGFIPSDIDSDGDVDIYDYSTLVQNFGRSI